MSSEGPPKGSKTGSKTGEPGSGTGAKPGSATGGKPGSNTGEKPGSGTGAKPGSATGGKPGSNTGAKPGSGTGAKPGSATGGKPGSNTGGKPGSGTGAKPGSVTDSKPSGSKTGAPPPHKSGTGEGKTGSKSGSNSGSKSGSNSGSKSGSQTGGKPIVLPPDSQPSPIEEKKTMPATGSYGGVKFLRSNEKEELHRTALMLMSRGKGILATDECEKDFGIRFTPLGVDNTPDNRRAYRQMLFTADGIEHYVSGAILEEEQVSQKADDGTTFPHFLKDKGIIPGVKSDNGRQPLEGSPDEERTKGIDDLMTRCIAYKKAGCEFTKWRCVIKIDERRGIPTVRSVVQVCSSLAQHGAISQTAGLVPIIEPEVMMDGPHGLERCKKVTKSVLKMMFEMMKMYGVYNGGILLKPNMVTAGATSHKKATPAEVAAATMEVFSAIIPQEVPGLVFLSGGQTEEDACLNLAAIVKAKGSNKWAMSFSFNRGLTQSARKAWAGKKENVDTAHEWLIKRAKAASQASLGKYAGGTPMF